MPVLETHRFVECIGYVAGGLVLTTFCFSNPVQLRCFALLSNIDFILFGYLGVIYPVMVLHMILVPINCFHLFRLLFPELGMRAAAERKRQCPANGPRQ